MTSEQRGLERVVEGETLRLYDPAIGEFLPAYAQAETQRLQEMQRAELAEEKLAALRRELDVLRQQQ